MVNSIGSGFQQQYPASKAFDAGQAPNNPAQTPKFNDGPQAAKIEPSSVQPGKTEEINAKVALSRDTSRINPSQIGNDSQQRGQNLDITA